MTNRQASAVERAVSGGLCAGCGACVAAAPSARLSMKYDRGFLRPIAAATPSPEEDRLVSRICPGLRVERPRGDRTHPIWGPYRSVWTGYATNEALRHHASSGGVLSAVLTHLLETGQIDAVVQTAASKAEPLHNAVVESIGPDDVYAAAGSRYAPSAPLQTLRDRLERPGRIAFVGKPCDVAALRAWQRADAEIADRVPFVVSFFCAGIPSQTGTEEVLKRLGVEKEDVLEFKYRGDGWPGYATARTRSGKTARMTYNDSWGMILNRYRPLRCRICPDGSGGLADFVCADAWYGDDGGYPDFTEGEGRSLVISRTETGDRILHEAADARRIYLEPCDIGEVVKMQPWQARRNQMLLPRLLAMRLFGRAVPRFTGFGLTQNARSVKLSEHLRSFLTMAKRVIRREI